MPEFVGLCNLHGGPSFNKMSKNRAVSSVSFLGRYALMDFPLSNFVNSGIDVANILIETHVKSILGHVGTLQTWNENTKIGKDRVMFNENAISGTEKNTDINNLIENPWLLYSDTKYIVVTSGHILMKLDYRPLMKLTVAEDRDLTIIYSHIWDADKSFLKGDAVEVKDDKVVSIRKNNGKLASNNVFTESYIISMRLLKELIKEDEANGHKDNLITLIKRKINAKEIEAYAYLHKGYIRNFDSFEHYYEYSLELLDKKPCDALFHGDWSYYTPTHDTPPAKYGPNSEVKDCYVANGSIVDGKLTRSILGRNVVIEKGAVVKNSIVLAGTVIKSGVRIENAVVDKFAIINKGNKIVGEKDNPAYVVKGTIM